MKSASKTFHLETEGADLYHVAIRPEKCICYNYIIFADSEPDAINRLIKNTSDLIEDCRIIREKAERDSDWYIYRTDKTEIMLLALQYSKYTVEKVDKTRGIPVSYFDDWRSNH